MIDFRYHIVSIVSIFLALAVGIVLGAGPLQGEIGNTLAKEVESLRSDKTQLNQELDASRTQTETRDDYINQTSAAALAGQLAAQQVALVILPGADGGVTKAVTTALNESGAMVASTTTLSADWVSTDVDVTDKRDQAVAAVATELGIDLSKSGPLPPRDRLLAALLTAGPAAPGSANPGPTRGMDALTTAGLLTYQSEKFGPASLVVMVSAVADGSDDAAKTEAAGRWVDLAIALDDASSGALLAASATTESGAGSVLASLRNDATAVKGVSSVDDALQALGPGSVVHGLLEQAAGNVGQYGEATGATAPFAPVPAPVPAP